MLTEAEIAYVAELSRFEAEQKELVETAITALPAAGYAVPMMVHLLCRRGNDTVDRVAPWGSADFSVLFRLLVEGLCNLTEGANSSDFPLYMTDALDPDPNVERYLVACYGEVVAINERIGVADGLLVVVRNGQHYRVTIANSRRRSALSLLRTKAHYLQHSEEERIARANATPLVEEEPDIWQRGRLTLMMNMREIDVLRKGLAKTWDRLLSKLGLEEEALLTFLTFSALVPAWGRAWVEPEEAFDLLNATAAHFTRHEVSSLQFEKLMDLFASDAPTARRIGTATPFLRIGARFLAWPFAHHALLPELVFVALVQSKRSDAWSSTFGSDLAEAADYLAAQLQAPPHIKIVTRRKKAGIGDIDLGIYDTSTGEFLICEIKTVFDRFRTEFQSSNFAEQRVNFDKALGQLNAARDALLTGKWSLSDVLGIPRLPPPNKVHRMVLLWRDHINPTLDAGVFVPFCDFATFRYLFEQCQGNPALLAESVAQLEKIFWVSSYHTDFWPVGKRQISFERELESGALPPTTFLDSLPLNDVVHAEVSSLVHFPEDWEVQMRNHGDERLPIFQSPLM